MKTLLTLSLLTLSFQAFSAVIIVNDNGDNQNLANLANDGKCSLREAVHAANYDVKVDACQKGEGYDYIRFDQSISSITLAGSALRVQSGRLAILGHSPDKRVTLDGNNQSRILENLDPDVILTLRNLTLTKGKTSGNTAHGGAIYTLGPLEGTNLYFFDNRVTGNSARGGAIYATNKLNLSKGYFWNNASLKSSGGAISLISEANSYLSDTVFNENTTERDGGAVTANVKAGGSLTIINNEFKRNKTVNGSGGALYVSGDNHMGGDLTIKTSSFYQNVATSGLGGAITARLVTSTLTNNTIALNQARTAAGISFAPTGEGKLIHNTIVLNTATSTNAQAAGVYFGGGTAIKLINNIIAANSHAGGNADCSGYRHDIVTAKNNLFYSAAFACGTTLPNRDGNLIENPKLGSLLADNSCTRKTGLENNSAQCTSFYTLQSDSPAIDNASDANESNITEDQRGLLRGVDGNGDGTARPDIGAYEASAVPRNNRINVDIRGLIGPLSINLNGRPAFGLNLGSAQNPYNGRQTLTQTVGNGETFSLTVTSTPDGQNCLFANNAPSIDLTAGAGDVTAAITCRTKIVYINYDNNAIANGEISCPADGQYRYGDSPTCTAIPDAGYEIATWGGDCANIAQGNSCQFNNITTHKNISVVFAPISNVPMFKDSFE